MSEVPLYMGGSVRPTSIGHGPNLRVPQHGPTVYRRQYRRPHGPDFSSLPYEPSEGVGNVGISTEPRSVHGFEGMSVRGQRLIPPATYGVTSGPS
jgi:hypothetical protein